MKVILTGATGMVGEGVLHECVQSDNVSSILVIGRKPCGYEHPKVKEIIVSDFMNLSGLEETLTGFTACFYCAGVSWVKYSEEDYKKFTYDLTLTFANFLIKLNPSMVFSYVSGRGTDSSYKWAKIKLKTENDLRMLSFRKVYNFRPGYLHPTPGLKNALSMYKYFKYFYPVIKFFSPNSATTLVELGRAMIQIVLQDYEKSTVEVKDILILSKT